MARRRTKTTPRIDAVECRHLLIDPEGAVNYQLLDLSRADAICHYRLEVSLGQGDDQQDLVQIRVTRFVSKLADAAWSMRTKRQRSGNPEMEKYENKHVAVFDKKIVAFGDDYAEVLYRAAKECGVPVSRIVMSYWGDPSTLQTVPEQ